MSTFSFTLDPTIPAQDSSLLVEGGQEQGVCSHGSCMLPAVLQPWEKQPEDKANT